jgi:serpin B
VSLRNTLARGTLFTVALGCVSLGCGGGQTGDEQTGDNGTLLQELRGTAPRLAARDALPNSASSDTWDFGWKFYHEEARPDANVFFSPYSIATAVSMLVAGAAGETKTEIDQALSFSNDDGAGFHQARNDVAQALEQRNRAGSEDLHAQTLRVTNDLWLHPGFDPAPSYLNTLSANYGLGVFRAPFDVDPEGVRQAINDKVARDTEQLIEELLPSDSIKDDTPLVLTNALYFKARWAREFSVASTRNEPFLGTAGERTVPIMHGRMPSQHYAGSDYEAIALPYFQRELELIAIMPPVGSFEAFSSGLDAAAVNTALSRLTPQYIDLAFPKLGLQSTVPLRERLEALGMRLAFSAEGDFSGISPELYLEAAFHQATLKLDEEGTEAAAATALVGIAVSAPPPAIPVTFDHPFVFFIRDVPSNSLLFVGHFANP